LLRGYGQSKTQLFMIVVDSLQMRPSINHVNLVAAPAGAA
jgi:hypothetical protein